jgi:hypothetical protein
MYTAQEKPATQADITSQHHDSVSALATRSAPNIVRYIIKLLRKDVPVTGRGSL